MNRMEELKPKGNTPEYRAWYFKNKYQAKGKASKKEKEQRNKEFITRVRKRCKCIKCKLDKWYLIEFHHMDPSTKYKGVTNLQFNAYGIKRIKDEIRKCVPICRNCHMEFHYLERNKIINNFQDYLTNGLY